MRLYLIAQLDTSPSYPIVTRCFTATESFRTLTLEWGPAKAYCDVMFEEGEDYDVLRARIVAWCEALKWEWALRDIRREETEP